MHQIVYLSAAVTLFSEEDLVQILTKSRKNNEKVQVSGVLLYYGGSIIQVLEGEKSQVQQTYDRISKDYRHRGIIKLLDRQITERAFPDWSMGFKALAPEQFSKVLGFLQPNTLEERKGKEAATTEDVMTLLKIFTASNSHKGL